MRRRNGEEECGRYIRRKEEDILYQEERGIYIRRKEEDILRGKRKIYQEERGRYIRRKEEDISGGERKDIFQMLESLAFPQYLEYADGKGSNY